LKGTAGLKLQASREGFGTMRRRKRVNNPNISGIVTGGLWIGAGMWVGGMIGGFIPQFGSGILFTVGRGLLSAYLVQMVAQHFTHNAGLMAAGAFAPSAWTAISSLLGGAGGGLISGGGGKSPVREG
jgi:hypothetical protein